MATTMSAPNQNQHAKKMLPTLMIFILILLGAVFFVKPLWAEVSDLSLGRDEKLAQKDTLTTQLQNLQNIQQQVNQGSEVSFQNTLNAVPQRFEQDKLIADITAIAKSKDILLNSVNFSINASNSERVKRATVNANLTGNLSGLLDFLKGIEANPRKFSVKTVSVQTGSTDAGIPRVNFNVNMETYYLDRL